MPAPLLYDHTGRYDDAGVGVLDQCRKMLLGQHLRITHCAGQLADSALWWRPREGMNSIANLMLHLAGNVGQWIVGGVGEQPFDRDRPAEFAAIDRPRAEVEARLTGVVQKGVAVLAKFDPPRLLEPLIVQGFDTTRLGATLHAVAHFEGHAQEIVCLTRQQLGEAYQPLWQPTSPEQQSVLTPPA